METIKKDILKSFVPRAVILPLNENSKQALANEKIIPIRNLPFKIGRESRMGESERGIFVKLRIMTNDSKPNNDLYLIDNNSSLEISKEHCEISFENNNYILKDRGSTNGTTINGVSFAGKNKIEEKILKDGDTIQIGSVKSEFKFQFLVFDI
ncbi:MAG: hypothetical protein C0625_11855 [Arcobacter sp.]|nr:MAG: hypothetical protein C0625_11855 [Arcobacter sp.]